MTDIPSHEVVTVNGRTLTVHRRTLNMQLSRFTLLEAAQADPPLPGDGLEAAIRNGFHRVTYPGLIACTTGDNIPTEQECYDTVMEELDNWLHAARRMNPDWFPVPGQTAEEEEKKESTQGPVSTSGSRSSRSRKSRKNP